MSVRLDVPQRTNGLTPLLTAFDRIGQFLIPLVVVIAFNSDGIVDTAINVAVIAAFASTTSIVSWFRFRWWVEGDRLRVRSGLFQIDDRTIPIERIQRIDRNQSLTSRFFGLYTLDAETAGGSGSELSIRYLDADEIEALESWFDSKRHTDETSDRVPERLVTTGLLDLVIAGATSNRIGALAVLLGTALQFFDDATTDTFQIFERWFPTVTDSIDSGSQAVWAGLVLVGLALLVGWGASIATTILRFYEFKLDLADGELRRSHGLLSRFRTTSPLHRVQAIRIHQALLRRILGYATVAAETAGSPGGEAGGSALLTPISKRTTAFDLAAVVLGPDRRSIESLESVSKLTIRRGFFRAIVTLAPAFGGASWYLSLSGGLAWVAPLTLTPVVAGWYAIARFRALGFGVTDDHIVTREGVLGRTWWSVPLGKVQTVAIRQSPFQRRLGLATISVDTAGGRTGIHVIDVTLSRAREIGAMLSHRSTNSFNIDAV